MYTQVKVVHNFRANDTSTIEDLNEELFQLHIPALVFVIVCLVIGVLGNILVLYIYKSKFKRSNHRYFILCLASIDLLACVIGLPFLIASLRLPYLMKIEAVCKGVRYVHYLVNNASGLLLVVISAERFQRICRPFRTQMSVKQTLKACFVVVVVSAVIAVPAPIFFGKSTVRTGVGNLTGTECYIANEFKSNRLMELYQGFLFVETIVCIVIFAILYTLIIRRVWTHDQFIDAMKSMKISSNSTYDSPSVSTDMADNERRADANGSDIKQNLMESIAMKAMKNSAVNHQNSNNGTESLPTTASTPTNNSIDDSLNSQNSGSTDVAKKGFTTCSLGRGGKKMATGNQLEKRTMSETLPVRGSKQPDVKRGTSGKGSNLSLRRMLSKWSSTSNSSKGEREKHKSRATVRVTIMLFTISIVFALAFIPHLVLMLMTAHSKDFLASLTKHQIIAYQLFLRIFIINNIANPIIYGFCDKKFRKCCLDILTGKTETFQSRANRAA